MLCNGSIILLELIEDMVKREKANTWVVGRSRMALLHGHNQAKLASRHTKAHPSC
jgi:mannitol/fructose-specific phosphotransferase system IIA component